VTHRRITSSLRHCVAAATLVHAALAGAQIPSTGSGQAYPVKPVRYVIPMSPGSGADTIGRIVAGGMSQALGQQVVIDNRTGAAGNIGAEFAAKSPPDGYTAFQASMTHAVNATLYTNLPYDLVRDFAAVTLVASSPSMVVVHPSLPVKSLAGLVKLAKAQPGALNYASTGAGTATFLAAEMFKSRAGVNLQHVPYRGGGESLIAVITGEVSVYLGPLAVVLPQVQQGKLRGLAVTTLKRLPGLDYPTVAESGYPGYEAGNWYGLVVPAKVPREAITALRNAVLAAYKNPAVAKRMDDLGYVQGGSAPEAFAAFMKSEIDKLAKILRQVGARTE
jgi:tripartite-type tricarboxylate transporter receptor subunit TctC